MPDPGEAAVSVMVSVGANLGPTGPLAGRSFPPAMVASSVDEPCCGVCNLDFISAAQSAGNRSAERSSFPTVLEGDVCPAGADVVVFDVFSLDSLNNVKNA